jgi:hypothetical protein
MCSILDLLFVLCFGILMRFCVLCQQFPNCCVSLLNKRKQMQTNAQMQTSARACKHKQTQAQSNKTPTKTNKPCALAGQQVRRWLFH